jgi:muconolactone delta-isomerase
MKILAIEQEAAGVTAQDFQPYLSAEAAKAWELYQTGIIRELYFHKDQHISILMLECEDEQEACDILATLPLVKEGLISFKLLPLIPYDGFSRLFTEPLTS